jgi:hypothetical protein
MHLLFLIILDLNALTTVKQTTLGIDQQASVKNVQMDAYLVMPICIGTGVFVNCVIHTQF